MGEASILLKFVFGVRQLAMTRKTISRVKQWLRTSFLLVSLLAICHPVAAQGVPAEKPLQNVSFADAFRTAVDLEIDELSTSADYYLYCADVDSYLLYTRHGKNSQYPTIMPQGLGKLLGSDGKSFITICQKTMVKEAWPTLNLGKSEPDAATVYEALVKVVRERAKKQIDTVIGVIASSLANNTSACISATGIFEAGCIVVRAKDQKGQTSLAQTSLATAIGVEDEVSKARLLINSAALLAIMGYQHFVVAAHEPSSFSKPKYFQLPLKGQQHIIVATWTMPNQLEFRLGFLSNGITKPRRSIEEIEAVSSRLDVISKAKQNAELVKWSREAEIQSRKDAELESRAAKIREQECARRPCKCDQSCEPGFKAQ